MPPAAAHRAGAVLPILLHPAPVLRALCAPPASPPLLLLSDLAASAAAHGALGLAAPQLGVALRALVLLRPVAWTEAQLGARAGRRRGGGAAPPPPPPYLACVNPRILHASAATAVGLEGCLSLPGLPALVRRAQAITVEYEDAQGERARLELSGLPAAVFQHELDHLDGVLLLDKQEPLPLGREQDTLRAADRAFRRSVAGFYPR
jgi:peptide deformylase